MKRVFVIMVVLVFSLFMCQSVFAVQGPAPKSEIKVGTLMAYTGPLKDYGPGIKNGAVLAAQQLTDAGLTVKLVHEDSETAPIAGSNAAKKLSVLPVHKMFWHCLQKTVSLFLAE